MQSKIIVKLEEVNAEGADKAATKEPFTQPTASNLAAAASTTATELSTP